MYTCLEIEHSNEIQTIWMNRAESHNALNPTLIQELTAAFTEAQKNPNVRAIILAGRGKSFSAGADLNWMQSSLSYSEEQNLEDAIALKDLFKTIYRSPKPVIARVHGPAIAGGTGLSAVCDIVVATSKARFGLTEVKLGLVPATIMPYIVEAIGQRQARRFALTAEIIKAEVAKDLGLVHELCAEEELDQTVQFLANLIVKNAPQALYKTKNLIQHCLHSATINDNFLVKTAQLIAQVRVGEEAQQGLTAFFAKQTPDWKPSSLEQEAS